MVKFFLKRRLHQENLCNLCDTLKCKMFHAETAETFADDAEIIVGQ